MFPIHTKLVIVKRKQWSGIVACGREAIWDLRHEITQGKTRLPKNTWFDLLPPAPFFVKWRETKGRLQWLQLKDEF